MKKRLKGIFIAVLIMLCWSLGAEFKAQAADIPISNTSSSSSLFPDSNFRTYLSNFDTSRNGYLSDAERNAVTAMNVPVSVANITSLNYFPNLTELKCSNSALKSLDLSGCNNLQIIDCSNNSSLTSLDVSGCKSLKTLNCSNTGITSLKLGEGIPLESLNLAGTKFSSLSISGLSQLKELNISGCSSLTSLSVTDNAMLETINCSSCGLSSITLSGNGSLKNLDCSGCKFASLNLSGAASLTSLKCQNNQLVSLDISSNTNLTALNCEGNQLSELNTSSNAKLQYLSCADNQLSKLDLKASKSLLELYCRGNSMKELELGSCKSLAYLSCYDNPLIYISVAETAMQKGLNGNICAVSSSAEASAESGASLVSANEKSNFISYEPGSVMAASLSDINAIGVINYKCKGEEVTLKISSVGFEAGDVRAPDDCVHIFRDYKHTLSMSNTSVRVYGNAVTIKNESGQKINRKTATLYTDIKPSYIYTEKNGKVTAKTGKVIAGLTMSDEKPVLSKNKIVDSQAASIAKVKIKSGMITITATGKGSGVVYLWVMDTGDEGAYAMCPINVAMGPKKMQAVDKPYNVDGGTVLKNPKFDAGTSFNIFLMPVGGDNEATGDCTYTVELDAKSQKYATITENSEGEYGYTITSTDASLKKKAKLTFKITCDQTGRSFKLCAYIVPAKVEQEGA